MMDSNEDVRSDTIQKFLDEVGMKEIILDHHGLDAPGTYIDGTLPIDEIFTSCLMNAVHAGYTSFEDGVQGQRTDHRCLWMDLDINKVFGSTTPPLSRFQGRRVKSNHPHIVEKFNAKYKEYIIKNSLSQKIFS